MNLAYKILKEHLIEGELIPGNQICIKIDQTLTQDSTGTVRSHGYKKGGSRKSCGLY